MQPIALDLANSVTLLEYYIGQCRWSVSVSHISCFIDLPNSIHDYHRRTRQESWGEASPPV